MLKLSVVAVNIDSPEWAELLIKSVQKFTACGHEIVIIDNGSLDRNLAWLREQDRVGHIRLLEQHKNLGHGLAMDLGTKVSKADFVCVLDIDCHLMREGWDTDLFRLYYKNPKLKMIGKKGPDHKPLHPPFFFYERSFILDNNISFEHEPGVSTDTAQKSYWDILNLGYEVMRIEGRPRGFERTYNVERGQEINLCGVPTFYHHWRGTRYNENNPFKTKSILDGITIEEYLEDKKKLFNQSLVKEILKGERK